MGAREGDGCYRTCCACASLTQCDSHCFNKRDRILNQCLYMLIIHVTIHDFGDLLCILNILYVVVQHRR